MTSRVRDIGSFTRQRTSLPNLTWRQLQIRLSPDRRRSIRVRQVRINNLLCQRQRPSQLFLDDFQVLDHLFVGRDQVGRVNRRVKRRGSGGQASPRGEHARCQGRTEPGEGGHRVGKERNGRDRRDRDDDEEASICFLASTRPLDRPLPNRPI